MSEPDPHRDGTPRSAPLVDWHRTARRLGRSLAVLAAIVVTASVVISVAAGAPAWARAAELLGLALLVAFVLEAVIVGGSALRGLLRAGERGDRLAGDDVALVPPQLLRRIGRRR